jgi:hypothetical protein
MKLRSTTQPTDTELLLQILARLERLRGLERAHTFGGWSRGAVLPTLKVLSR